MNKINFIKKVSIIDAKIDKQVEKSEESIRNDVLSDKIEVIQNTLNKLQLLIK